MILGSAAGVVKELEKHGPYVMPKWLKETVGTLEAKRPALGKSLRALPYPILTTNYDGLLENNDRRAIDWTNSAEMQQIIAGGSRSIGHLHGIWSNPSSVVFSDKNYDRLLESEAAQSLQRAASTLKSIVYVGFGSGLTDPNFSRMIDWHRSHFFPSAVDHFRLCRTRDLDGLRAEHGTDHIIPVVYGDDYDDLPSFLEQFTRQDMVELSKAGIARDLVGESQTDFAEEMKGESILAETLDGILDRPMSDVILPPILIPVPHAEYINARTKKSTARVARLDPAEEIKLGDVLIIAAEENSGLTMAVKWMTLEASRFLVGAAPIYVPFQTCKKTRRPIQEQVRAEAQRQQLIRKRDEALPPYVLGLDDFTPYVDRISEAALAEIAESEALLTIIGCAQGVEDELARRLKRLGVSARVRYLGKLSAADIRNYARLVSPSDFESLAEQVLTALQVENLAKTPFTVSLLLFVLVQGGRFSANASQTSILDDFVGLLLGRGDPHDDARFGLDQSAREAILSGLAQTFVEAGVGGLTEIDVQESFQAVFDKFGWIESTSEVLGSFIDRKVLRRKGRYIEFSRSSFLHLFAAKRATLDKSFRSKLLERPIYYSAAITDYAALYRHDADLLGQLSELLKREYATTAHGSMFESLELAPPRLHDEGFDDLEELGSTGAEADHAADTLVMRDLHDDFFDNKDDRDLPPFPTTHEDDVPPAVQLFRTLDLVSTVLRDSDQVEDLDLKQAVLADVLEKWGLAMDVMHEDSSFNEFLKRLLIDLELAKPEKDGGKALLEELGKAIPAAITLGGIETTLSSRKLTLLLERVMNDSNKPPSEESVIMACFFHFSLREPGWPNKLTTLLRSQGNIWIVRNFLLHLLTYTFQMDDVEPDDAEDLLDLCALIIQRSSNYKDEPEQRRHRAEITSDLQSARLKSRVRKGYAKSIAVV
ncbi:SIR2 family protein [Cryobacterium sp. 10S3]|uniref:SIR2 family protein n=1 Tax=Cryobacterium sp. 10S3 TaxID=3048582 RepID=UPI002AC9AC5B|nr:SIR2 family protein [Cryobacterium sp. 10S3]MEB0286203.1 SIR2 family protein [Cryobacterium sp. 10S3]WPX12261.1 SIR2 family protein [Cryobacterium sp. 10S3]